MTHRESILDLKTKVQTIQEELETLRQERDYYRNLAQITYSQCMQEENGACKLLLNFQKARENFFKAEKLAVIDATSGRVAHEILNPIAAVFSRVESNIQEWRNFREVGIQLHQILDDWQQEYHSGQLMSYLSSPGEQGRTYGEEDFLALERFFENAATFGEKQLKDLQFIHRQLQRVTKIINNARESSRNCRSVTLIEPKLPIAEALEILQDLLRTNGIRIELDIPEAMPPFLGDESEMVQVFTNLLRNSIQSIEEKQPACGTIRVVVRREGGLITIRIIDNGCGVPADIRDHIFDANYSSKNQQKGTGLGLTISRRLVRANGGEISLETSAGTDGATFLISLPSAPIKGMHPTP